MKPKYLIKEINKLPNAPQSDGMLDVNEFFCDTLQGEGRTMGKPAMFLRLAGCTLDCSWCDTPWTLGRRYSFNEIFEIMEKPYYSAVQKLEEGHHLILTGGSPVKQQKNLSNFLDAFRARYHFVPIIEVENECVLKVIPEFSRFVSYWNNSPKLANSNMKVVTRYKPDVIRQQQEFKGGAKVSFKFVIAAEEDMTAVMNYIDLGLIRREDVILMPVGATLEELKSNEQMVGQLAITHCVQFSSRLQLYLQIP